MYAHRCRSSHQASRTHCHGNHFCIHSGTSLGGWHSGSGCGTQSDPLHTRRCLRTQNTHCSISSNHRPGNKHQPETSAHLCLFFACSLICASWSGGRWSNQNIPAAATAKLGQWLPTFHSQHLCSLSVTAGIKVFQKSHHLAADLFPFLHFSVAPPHLFCRVYSSLFVSGIRRAYTCLAQRRWVHAPSRESKSLSSIMYGVSSVPHLQLSGFWLQRPDLCTHTLLVKEWPSVTPWIA